MNFTIKLCFHQKAIQLALIALFIGVTSTYCAPASAAEKFVFHGNINNLFSVIEKDGAYQTKLDVNKMEFPKMILRMFSEKYDELVKSKKIYFWEMLDRKDRFEHYCYDECACVASTISQDMAKIFTHRNIYRVAIHAQNVNVLMGFANNLRPHQFFYHVSNIILDQNGSMGIFDPVLFYDSQLHTFNELMMRLEPTKNATVEITKWVF